MALKGIINQVQQLFLTIPVLSVPMLFSITYKTDNVFIITTSVFIFAHAVISKVNHKETLLTYNSHSCIKLSSLLFSSSYYFLFLYLNYYFFSYFFPFMPTMNNMVINSGRVFSYPSMRVFSPSCYEFVSFLCLYLCLLQITFESMST